MTKNFEALYANPLGRTTRAQFVPAMITVLVAVAFYQFYVTGRTATFCMLVLMYPAFVLLACRARDMGYSAWLVMVPVVPTLVSFAIILDYFSLGVAMDTYLPWVGLAISAGYVVWGCVKK